MLYIFKDINIINNVFRCFPLEIQLYSLFAYIISQNNDILYLFFSVLLSELSSPIFKEVIFKNICNINNIDKIPLFGTCNRPIGAMNCSSFLSCEKKNSTSYGMPSGHSQVMGAATGYLYLYIKHKTDLKKNNKYLYYFIQGLLVFMNIYMAYTRVYVYKCHTIGHTIIGALIGFIISKTLFFKINKKKII
tara:strand:+ start:2321 stop:2893 length:573 start_codon:yes stop_codon:yes gene_type:complete